MNTKIFNLRLFGCFGQYEENQRLINLAIAQIIQKLNFSYQQEIKNDQQAFEYFLS